MGADFDVAWENLVLKTFFPAAVQICELAQFDRGGEYRSGGSLGMLRYS